MKKGKKVLVRWEHEGGSEMLEMSKEDADKAKKLLVEGEKIGEFPDEVNKILDRATKTAICGSIATCGDGWGWYEEGDEE